MPCHQCLDWGQRVNGSVSSFLVVCKIKCVLSSVALVVKNAPANAGDARDVGSIPGCNDPLEKEMTIHSSSLACRIPWTEEPGGPQSKGSQRVRHD